MGKIEVSAGYWVEDESYGGIYPPGLTTDSTPEAQARAYFEQSGTVVSPTADAQRWPVPATESFIPAPVARRISLEVRTALGARAL